LILSRLVKPPVVSKYGPGDILDGLGEREHWLVRRGRVAGDELDVYAITQRRREATERLQRCARIVSAFKSADYGWLCAHFFGELSLG